tara:strand:- start:228 stop:458 length:231 start_codon:yes stop_codon:yes gene_type:complete
MKVSNSLGERVSSQFERGDIVFWKKLGEEGNIGMVYEFYTVEMGGRQIKKARVASFRDTFHYDVLIMELKLVSKAK